MSSAAAIFTQKDIKRLVRSIKEQANGVFDYSESGGLHRAVMSAIGDSGTVLISEFVSTAIKQVIDEDAKFEMSPQIDFIGYSEKIIKLTDRQAVKVKDAKIDHIRHQKEQLLKNHLRQIQGFLIHHDGYIAPILAAMEEQGFETAGEAIAFITHNNPTP